MRLYTAYMESYDVTWHNTDQNSSNDLLDAYRQAYVWLITTDDKVIIVSKDNTTWQLPGGKPNSGETREQTAIREVLEETGVDISEYRDSLQFFGYNVVKELASNEPPYTQVRYLLKVPKASHDLPLHTANEDPDQDQQDVIKFVRAVSIDEALALIPWLESSAEFGTVRTLL